jgi:TM2 domain-containing membrane protein YozV
MRYCFLSLAVLIIILPLKLPAQDLHSPANVRKFADYLFCSKDYLRAVYEYEDYLKSFNNDTVKFKLALSYRHIGEYKKASDTFLALSAPLNHLPEFYVTLFMEGDYPGLQNSFTVASAEQQSLFPVKQLYLYSFLLSGEKLPLISEYKNAFNNNDTIINFYQVKSNPPYRSPALAAVMSAIIPGSGKIYTGQYGDGITAFLVTGVLTYLSWVNFDAHHQFRGWLFSGLAAMFYGGNIYGSAASAQLFNAGVKISLDNELKAYLDDHNYFMPEYNFCR